MSEYTKEPWTADTYDLVWSGETLVAICRHNRAFAGKPTRSQCVANARRIVACVNALAGIPTEEIEAGLIGDVRSALIEVLGIWDAGFDEEECCYHLSDRGRMDALRSVLTRMGKE